MMKANSGPDAADPAPSRVMWTPLPSPHAARNQPVARSVARLWLLLLVLPFGVNAQDASTGAIRGTVEDAAGARVAVATVVATSMATAVARRVVTDGEGNFSFQLLPPGEYNVRVQAERMTPQVRSGIIVELGGLVELHFALRVAMAQETVEVSGATPLIETHPSAVSAVVDERALQSLPLNGRRFTDLALLTPGVTQDPRSLTSASNGDLAFGGIRGFQSSYLVDGADNNNAFFAQARGRYRAPYQFSNEVIQEFRVSSNSFGVELGRAGGAVVNVVTKSGSNRTHGSAFYYVRDSRFNAQQQFVDYKPADRQQQGGFTLGGRIQQNRVFYFVGFDQHIFHVPTVVRFLNGSSTLAPQPADYEATDQALVAAAAGQLSTMGGEFRSQLLGNAALAKLDVALSTRHSLALRVSTSRYWGANNVFFDPASPITYYGLSENGEERVRTESAVASLTSSITFFFTSHLRAQFSRDVQESFANSEAVRTRIANVIEAFGRSSMLPRRTREHRLHLAETLVLDGRHHEWKFGGDVIATWIYNFYPSLFGGEYIFDDIRVSPWTFAPQTYGMRITPLRAYAHAVPRYYVQNFGNAVARPDTNELAGFAQDTMRLGDHLAIMLGLRYDLQTFRSQGREASPYWSDSGKVLRDTNNFAPRFGFSYAIGHTRPVVVRGGYGLFYTRIPSIYTSAIETDNGVNSTHLLLDNADQNDQVFFPAYPAPLTACGITATACAAPGFLGNRLTTEISTFAPNFRTPSVQQSSVTVEREVAPRLAISGSYLYVHGQHLIRARDVNLPSPIEVTYPVYDETGTDFLGDYYQVDSFSTWQMTSTLTCPFPPCMNPLARPIPQVGAINTFESAASSVYHGLTVSARRRVAGGLYFRLAYTWARAIDDGQDALVVRRPATVQNSYSPQSERGRSVTDQRHRFVFSWIYDLKRFRVGQPVLKTLVNDWRISGVVTFGSGRPVNARIVGDANRDGNSDNDRLPGYRRNSFTGPDYSTTDLRLTRKLKITKGLRLELQVESFNVFNRANQRVAISDDGYLNTAGQFVAIDKAVGAAHYPAHYRTNTGFMLPTSAYAPRQIQFAARMVF